MVQSEHHTLIIAVLFLGVDVIRRRTVLAPKSVMFESFSLKPKGHLLYIFISFANSVRATGNRRRGGLATFCISAN